MLINVDGESFELSDDIVEDFGNLTELQQNFTLWKLSGMTNRDAYVMSGGTATDERSISVCASRMHKDPKVKSVLDRARALRFTRHIMDRDEMAARLSLMARTEISDVVEFVTDEEDPKAQTRWRLRPVNEMGGAGIRSISEVTAGKDGLKVKLHDQKDAMKQLSALMGYDKAQKVSLTVAKGLDDLYDEFDEE